jgi:hypothetical protein
MRSGERIRRMRRMRRILRGGGADPGRRIRPGGVYLCVASQSSASDSESNSLMLRLEKRMMAW